LLDESQKFREWIQGLNPDAKLTAEYVRDITAKGWMASLPAKMIRYVLASALGMASPAAGLAVGVVDSFLLDRIANGWRPSHFVEGTLKRSSAISKIKGRAEISGHARFAVRRGFLSWSTKNVQPKSYENSRSSMDNAKKLGPKLSGKCPICDDPMVAKCGEERIGIGLTREVAAATLGGKRNRMAPQMEGGIPDAWQEIVHTRRRHQAHCRY